MFRSCRRCLAYSLLAWLASAWPPAATAHEIPNDITIQTLVRPSSNELTILLRVPMEAMVDIDFPLTDDGFLDFANADATLRNAAQVWLLNDIRFFENGSLLEGMRLAAVRAALPSDGSFRSFSSALAHMRAERLPSGTQLVWQQALLDVLLSVPIESENSQFSIDTSFARLGLSVTTVIRYVSPTGKERVFTIDGNSGLQPLAPSAVYAASRFLVDGFQHILDGADHLLFLLCMVVPFRRRMKSLVWIVTAFTIAHSITLIGSAYGLAPDALWFPSFVEMLIALSIFYLAVENAVRPTPTLRLGIAFAFGLVHGFGFSFALRNTLQFAGDHLLISLLSFNVGVEIGQLLVLVLFVAGLNATFRYILSERVGVLLIAVVVGHTAWHWMLERYDVWSAYDISTRDALATLVGGPRFWLALALAAAATIVLVWRAYRDRHESLPHRGS